MKLIHFEDITHGHVFVRSDKIVALIAEDTGTAVIVESGGKSDAFHVTTDVQELASLIERFVDDASVILLM